MTTPTPTTTEQVLDMELRQQSLEKEMSVLKDTVWRLTGRVFVLESFLSEKFDELVVDFGLRLSVSSGGHAHFLAQAMSAEATVVRAPPGGSNHPNPSNRGDGESEEMSTEGGDQGEGEGDHLDKDPSSPPVGANITIEEIHSNHNGNGDKPHNHGHVHGHQNHHGHGHHRNNSNSVSLSSLSSLVAARESRHPHVSRFLYKRDPNEVDERNSNTDDGDHYHSQSDFNVEEFVVFPQVPEFILGQEVQNGSSEALMSAASSEDSNASESGPHHNRHTQQTLSSPPQSSSTSNFAIRRNPRYKCIPCAKLFTSEWHLKAHLVKHSEPNLITTNTSSSQGSPPGHDSSSASNSLLQPKHEGYEPSTSKPFACVYCGKRFRKRQELTVHLRTHTGEKPYKCPVCDRGFSQSSSMKTHLRIHTGEKPFKCRFCKSSFTVMHNYKKHLQTAHQIDDFS